MKAFYTTCSNVKLNQTLLNANGFKLSYTSTIPRMVIAISMNTIDSIVCMLFWLQVGLSGSSAIITATLRALLTHYNLTLSDIGIAKADLPDFILNIEKKELGESAWTVIMKS